MKNPYILLKKVPNTDLYLYAGVFQDNDDYQIRYRISCSNFANMIAADINEAKALGLTEKAYAAICSKHNGSRYDSFNGTSYEYISYFTKVKDAMDAAKELFSLCVYRIFVSKKEKIKDNYCDAYTYSKPGAVIKRLEKLYKEDEGKPPYVRVICRGVEFANVRLNQKVINELKDIYTGD